MAKNILSLAYKDALDYFMSASNYSTLELPEYMDMTPILKHVRKTIGSKAFEDCAECEPLCSEALNYTMNLNKDGKYAIRPIALVNPYIYYFFAREICSKDNWNYLKAWFKAVQQPSVTACSLPVISDEKEAFHNSTTILNYCCPIKVLIRHKLGLIPFSGISPLWLFSSYEKTKINHEQKYTF